jgi:uncharacterized membrane protein (UPF0127 family)
MKCFKNKLGYVSAVLTSCLLIFSIKAYSITETTSDSNLGNAKSKQQQSSRHSQKSPAEKITFRTATLKIGTHQMKVELAESDEQKEFGLMYRQKLEPNTGMLFIFDDEQYRTFWMKNTFIDLSIGYFDKNKKLVDTHEMTGVHSVMETPKTYPSSSPAMYALEMPPGWFSKNKIKIGSAFSLQTQP